MTTKLSNITSIPDIQIPKTTLIKSESEIAVLVNEFFKNQTVSKGVPDNIPESLDIFDFLYLVRKAVESRQNSEGIKEENRILFLEDDPSEEIDTEAIAFVFKERIPGRFSQGSITSGTGVREVTSHLRAYSDHPTIPGQKLLTYGRNYESSIIFYTYAKTTKVALKRALWFSKVMDSFSWVFFQYGFRAIEEDIGKREKIKIKDLDLIRYPVSYKVRSDNVYHVSSQELREILIDVQTLS